MEYKIKNLFDLNNTIAKEYLNNYIYPFEILPNIEKIILSIGNNLDENFIKKNNNIWIHKNSIVEENCTVKGPCIIDENAKIGPNSYIRENVIIGKNAIIGNSSEIKNSIIFNNTKIPHFNYIGDSIIGANSNLSAGVITSNQKLDKTNIKINNIDTNLKKIGSFIADNVEIGCNTVLNPGTIIGRNSVIYPLQNIRGYIEENVIYKTRENICKKI